MPTFVSPKEIAALMRADGFDVDDKKVRSHMRTMARMPDAPFEEVGSGNRWNLTPAQARLVRASLTHALTHKGRKASSLSVDALRALLDGDDADAEAIADAEDDGVDVAAIIDAEDDAADAYDGDDADAIVNRDDA